MGTRSLCVLLVQAQLVAVAQQAGEDVLRLQRSHARSLGQLLQPDKGLAHAQGKKVFICGSSLSGL